MIGKLPANGALDDAKDVELQRPRGRPRNAGTRTRIMDSARAQFAEYGLDGTSLDRIAESAGTTKVTMYTHFPSKEALFNAVANEGRTHAFSLDVLSLPVDDPYDSLLRIANRYSDMIADTTVISHMRLVSANVGKYPVLGASFYESGPQKVAQAVSAYLEKLAGEHVLDIRDPDEAAEQFLGLLKGQEYMRTILGLPRNDSFKQQGYLKSCVDMFLRAYKKYDRFAGGEP